MCLLLRESVEFGVKEPLTMTELVSVKIKLAQIRIYSDITVTSIILAYESNMTVRFLKVVFLGFPGGSRVKNLPAMQKTWVRSLGWKDPLEEKWGPTPVFLPGESPWAEEPGELNSVGSQRVRYGWATKHKIVNIIHN